MLKKEPTEHSRLLHDVGGIYFPQWRDSIDIIMLNMRTSSSEQRLTPAIGFWADKLHGEFVPVISFANWDELRQCLHRLAEIWQDIESRLKQAADKAAIQNDELFLLYQQKSVSGNPGGGKQ